MKNLFKAALLVMMITIAQPSHSENRVREVTRTETLDAAEAQRLVKRLEEIKAMDRSTMSRSEKRALRREIKETQKTLDSAGGIYLSVGAVILIIVLLIIF